MDVEINRNDPALPYFVTPLGHHGGGVEYSVAHSDPLGVGSIAGSNSFAVQPVVSICMGIKRSSCRDRNYSSHSILFQIARICTLRSDEVSDSARESDAKAKVVNETLEAVS